MIIGIPKEIKKNEYRVACNPDGVKEITSRGHTVLVEKGAGLGSGYTDEEYTNSGAVLLDTPKEVFEKAELIYKVKEIFPQEFQFLRENQIVFTYIHSNAYKEQTDAMLEKGVVGIAYEDVDDKDGEFPLLKPMSIIAGKGGFLAALHFMQRVHGGNGILLSRVDGVRTPEIAIIGAGNSGVAAAEMAAAFGNKVAILDISIEKLEMARKVLPSNVELLISNRANLEECLKRTDVLINCILWPKWRKDHLVSRDMLKMMKPGSMIVDVACDDEGAIETTHSTSHDDPIYVVDGITHYCVDNIPSAFSQTATTTLCNATVPYVLQIAEKGVKKALMDNKFLRRGLSTYEGKLTLEETGRKQDRPWVTPEEALGMN